MSLSRNELNSSLKEEDNELVTWKDLGLVDVLCEACLKLNWKKPLKIQKEAIPVALEGKDVIAVAETGSGKTAAFALPILQSLLDQPQRFFALILTPTRELALQICQQFEDLGLDLGVKTGVLVGGVSMVLQGKMLSKKPHILVATPGRLLDHLSNTKRFHLNALRYLVMDEADRMLNTDFGCAVDLILEMIPKERKTFLFSATMTEKVEELQKACLRDPIKLAVSSRVQTVDKLQQYYIIPYVHKESYLVHLLTEMAGNSFIIFCPSCNSVLLVASMLQSLGFTVTALHGKMAQKKRFVALNKFKTNSRSILVATNVASRGLDIPHVDVVINYTIPKRLEDYIHRVGRTARASRAGVAINFVTKEEVGIYQALERKICRKLPLYQTQHEEVISNKEKIDEALRKAKMEMKEKEKEMKTKKRKKDVDNDDEVQRKKKKIFFKKGGKKKK